MWWSPAPVETESPAHPDLKTKPDYDIQSMRDYMKPEHIQQLETLRKAIPATFKDDKYLDNWCTDATLCRFLRARNWNQEEALNQLVKTLQWRLEYGPHRITAEDVKSELDNKGKMYRNGIDKFKRPVLYMKPGLDNTGPEDRDQKVKYLVYLMEKCAIAANKENREKLCLLIDFKNNAPPSLGNMQVAKDVLDVLQNYYPESLGRAMIFNAPWSFSVFWSFISPFLETVTKDKIQFVSSQNEFLEYISKEELETEYGGENTWRYDFAQHWKKED